MKKESNLFSYLITNKDFRDWVLSPDEESKFFWKKWMAEHPEATEDVKKAREFIERMSFQKEQLSHFESDDLLEKILANEKPASQSKLFVQPKPFKRKKTFYSIEQWIKVAAILVVCVVSSVLINGFFSLDQPEPTLEVVEWVTVENPKGRKSKITLPDGTMVMLNSASEFKYPKSFSGSQRLVELKGEAFFEVVRNEEKPFIIQTNRMTTEVLGTSFNINAYAGNKNQYTAVVTGTVKVKSALGDAKLLNANEMGIINHDLGILKTSFDLKQVIGWKDGIISFKRASFPDIQEQLSRWYGVDFVVDKGFEMDSVYTGEFVNESLENVMNGIAYSSDFEYKITDNKVYILKKLNNTTNLPMKKNKDEAK